MVRKGRVHGLLIQPVAGDSLEERASELERELQESVAQMASLSAAGGQADARIAELTGTNAGLREEGEALRRQLDGLQTERDALEAIV